MIFFLQLRYPCPQLLRENNPASVPGLQGHDRRLAERGNLVRAGIDDDVLHEDLLVVHLRHPRSDGDPVGAGEGGNIAAACRFDNERDPRPLLEFVLADAPVKFDAGILHVAEVDHVVDVAVGVHVAPGDGLFNDQGIVLESVSHRVRSVDKVSKAGTARSD